MQRPPPCFSTGGVLLLEPLHFLRWFLLRRRCAPPLTAVHPPSPYHPATVAINSMTVSGKSSEHEPASGGSDEHERSQTTMATSGGGVAPTSGGGSRPRSKLVLGCGLFIFLSIFIFLAKTGIKPSRKMSFTVTFDARCFGCPPRNIIFAHLS